MGSTSSVRGSSLFHLFTGMEDKIMFTVQFKAGGRWIEHGTTDDRDLAKSWQYFLAVEGFVARIVRNE